METEEISEDELKARLSPDEYRVLREAGTEAPYSGAYVENKETGMYHCRACGAVLFSSEKKFDSGSGWPSFTDSVGEAGNVGTRADDSHGMRRTEVYCKSCDSHLGHVFDDGPKERGGLRYCINSVALDFEQNETL